MCFPSIARVTAITFTILLTACDGTTAVVSSNNQSAVDSTDITSESTETDSNSFSTHEPGESDLLSPDPFADLEPPADTQSSAESADNETVVSAPENNPDADSALSSSVTIDATLPSAAEPDPDNPDPVAAAALVTDSNVPGSILSSRAANPPRADAFTGEVVHYGFEPLSIRNNHFIDGAEEDGKKHHGPITNNMSAIWEEERGHVLESKPGSQGIPVSIGSTSRNYTFALWFKGSAPANGGYLFDQESERFVISLENLNVYVAGEWRSPARKDDLGAKIFDQQWHHIAFILRDDELSIMIDGELQDADPTTDGHQSVYRLPVGVPYLRGKQSFLSHHRGAYSAVTGRIDDLHFYNEAVLSSNIKRVMLRDGTYPQNRVSERPRNDAFTGEVINYSFEPDTFDGTVISDIATGDGKAQDAVVPVATAVVWDAGRGHVLETTKGFRGFSTSIKSTSRNYTFMMWYKGGQPDTSAYVFDQKDERFVISLRDFNVYVAGKWRGPSRNADLGRKVFDKKWHHIAFILRDDQYSIMIDGQLQDADPDTSGSQNYLQLPIGVPWLKGNQQLLAHNNRQFAATIGRMDDFRFYNRAVLSSDIQKVSTRSPRTNLGAGLTAGVTNLGLGSLDRYGRLAIYGDGAFSVALNNTTEAVSYGGYSTIIGGALVDKGRVLAFGLKEWGNFKVNSSFGHMERFYRNAILFASGIQARDKISIVTDNADTYDWLKGQGYSRTTLNAAWETMPAGTQLLISAVEENPSSQKLAALTRLFASGGGMIASATGYRFSNPRTSKINNFFASAGIGWINGYDSPVPGRAGWPLVKGTAFANAVNFHGGFSFPSEYSRADRNMVTAALLNHKELASHNNDAGKLLYRNLASEFKSLYPSDETPVTDEFQRALLTWEGGVVSEVPVNNLWAHRAAYPVDSGARRLSKARVSLNPKLPGHTRMRLDTGYYAPPGEVVTITVPAAAASAGLKVAIGHFQDYAIRSSMVAMPNQQRWFEIKDRVTKVGSVHGGLILFYVPAAPTDTDGMVAEISGAIQAPVFRLGEHTNADWQILKRRGGVKFITLYSDQVVLIFDIDVLEKYADNDINSLLKTYANSNHFMEYYTGYQRRNRLRIHMAPFPLGGASSMPLSYNYDKKFVLTDQIVAEGQHLTLHEHGHHIDGLPNRPADNYGEAAANIASRMVKRRLNMSALGKFEEITNAKNNLNKRDTPSLLGRTEALDELGMQFGGAEVYRPIMLEMRAMSREQLPTNADVAGEWVKQIGKRVGYDITNWFKQWNIQYTSASAREVSGLPKWNKITMVPRAIVAMKNQDVVMDAPWSADYSYDGVLKPGASTVPNHGTLRRNANGTYTYSPNRNYLGADEFTYEVSNRNGNKFTNTVKITVIDPAESPKINRGRVALKVGQWTTVKLPESYRSMVVVTSPIEIPGKAPFVTRITNVQADQFDIMAQRADGQSGAISGLAAEYMVVEEGSYSATRHGIRMEARKFNSTHTDYAKNFKLVRQRYNNRLSKHYFNPVTFGQVMSYNDPNWSVFWQAGIYREIYSPTADGFYLGKHVGEDPNTERADETLGFIVIGGEQPIVHYGNLRMQTAGLNPGTERAPFIRKDPKTYKVMGSPPAIIGGLIGTGGLRGYGRGEHGFWPVLVGSNPFPSRNSISFRIAQDTIMDDLEQSANLSSTRQSFVVFSDMNP